MRLGIKAKCLSRADREWGELVGGLAWPGNTISKHSRLIGSGPDLARQIKYEFELNYGADLTKKVSCDN